MAPLRQKNSVNAIEVFPAWQPPPYLNSLADAYILQQKNQKSRLFARIVGFHVLNCINTEQNRRNKASIRIFVLQGAVIFARDVLQIFQPHPVHP